MVVRAFAVMCLSLWALGQAHAQFGAPKPTPKSADEYFAERALRDAARLTEGVSGREVIKPEDGVDLARAEQRMEAALEVYNRLCTDRTLPRDQWARNCFALGEMYRRGTGTEQDYQRAKTLYDEACFDGDHTGACMQQAFISQKGTGGDVDLPYAWALYDHGCKLDDAAACAGLGNMMYMGRGGRRDQSEAIRLLQESCADEYEWACPRLIEYGLPAPLDRS